jgi:hypothetical protein
MSKSDIKRKYWPTREWQAADPASVGMNPEKFMYLEDSLESQYRSINGIVVVRKGYIVFERYNDGAIRVENRSPGIRTAKQAANATGLGKVYP